jgi:crotonobetainyl-CoA:carnitine CoA-transferase CaiB-like acyl-CoA transferase
MTKKKRRHTPEQIVKKLRDADAMVAAGKTTAEVLQHWKSVKRRSIVGATSTAA